MKKKILITLFICKYFDVFSVYYNFEIQDISFFFFLPSILLAILNQVHTYLTTQIYKIIDLG